MTGEIQRGASRAKRRATSHGAELSIRIDPRTLLPTTPSYLTRHSSLLTSHSSVRPAAADNGPKGTDEDAQVEQHREVLDVEQVELRVEM